MPPRGLPGLLSYDSANRGAAAGRERGIGGQGHFFFGDRNMNAIERIKDQLAKAPVVLYMKGTPDFPQCGFSAQTVAALRALGAEFKSVNIFEEPEMREAL